jgi:hypothetical protein
MCINDQMRKVEDGLNAHKLARLATIIDVYSGFSTLVDDFERPTTSKGQKRAKNDSTSQ